MSLDESDELHRRVKEVFFGLIEEPRERWDGLLVDRCGGDERLREEVESLIAHVQAETRSLRPAIEVAPGELPAGLSEGLISQVFGGSRRGSESEGVPGRHARRFAVGEVVAERYRIEEHIGAGGMGTVWRAYDELLSETVALKFIRSRARDEAWIERLLQEASVARRVTHRGVCRVHDAGRVDGEFFISMEFVRGSDLAERLERTGRLDRESTVRLARELVDALVAVHAEGLLHRDLKPANVLLDEEGSARVTDFGLAISRADASERDSSSGTRGYMAPEQLQGGAPSEASDVYALGLLLYEAVSNRRAFRTAGEMALSAERGETPPCLSVFVDDMDPVVEHVVMRCLASDPAARPRAAELQRALALADPLDAVLALGDVPTARVIAEARSRPALRPAQAGAVIGAFLAGVLLHVVLTHASGARLLPALSPVEAAERARVVLDGLDELDRGSDAFEVYRYASEAPRYERSGYRLASRNSEHPADRAFWYRRGPRPISPTAGTSQLFAFGRAQPFDPAPGEPGTSTVVFDSLGYLTFLDDRREPSSEHAEVLEPELDRLFEIAGIDRSDFAPCEPLLRPMTPGDGRLAWSSARTGLRSEATIDGGRIVAFELLEPSNREAAAHDTAKTFVLVNAALIAALFLAILPRALRHFRSGRGDPLTHMTVAATGSLALFLSWLLYADSPAVGSGLLPFIAAGAFFCVSCGVLIWILGIAIEPSVQRSWPRTLVTWSRFVRGRASDPRVRSDVLRGMGLGAIPMVVQPVIGRDAACLVGRGALDGSGRWSSWIASMTEALPSAILLGFEFLAVLTVVGWITRERRAAILATWAIACLLGAGATETPGAMVLEAFLMTLTLFCLVRYGLLSVVALLCTRGLFHVAPFDPSSGSWSALAAHASAATMIFVLIWVAWPLLRRADPV